MDQQKLSQLDSKLRDAYQRVMGTTIPGPQAAPTPPQANPASTPTPSSNQTQAVDPNPIPAPQPQPQPEPTSPPFIGPTPTAEEPRIFPKETPAPESKPEQIVPPASNTGPQIISTPEPVIPMPPQPASNFVQMNSEIPAAPPVAAPVPTASNFSTPPQTQAIAMKKKGNALTTILFGIAGLTFLVVYTFFWTKIFDLKLPFLP